MELIIAYWDLFFWIFEIIKWIKSEKLKEKI